MIQFRTFNVSIKRVFIKKFENAFEKTFVPFWQRICCFKIRKFRLLSHLTFSIISNFQYNWFAEKISPFQAKFSKKHKKILTVFWYPFRKNVSISLALPIRIHGVFRSKFLIRFHICRKSLISQRLRKPRKHTILLPNIHLTNNPKDHQNNETDAEQIKKAIIIVFTQIEFNTASGSEKFQQNLLFIRDGHFYNPEKFLTQPAELPTQNVSLKFVENDEILV